MQIGQPVSADSLPFEHPLQTNVGKLRTAMSTLNGSVLPITPSDGEKQESMRQLVYYVANQLGIKVSTTVHDGTIYVHKQETA